MSLENVLLKETVLTSTQNKYLNNEDSSSYRQLDSGSLKRKFPLNLLDDWKILNERNPLTSTENMLLKNDISVLKKKRKKYRREMEREAQSLNYPIMEDTFGLKKKHKKRRFLKKRSSQSFEHQSFDPPTMKAMEAPRSRYVLRGAPSSSQSDSRSDVSSEFVIDECMADELMDSAEACAPIAKFGNSNNSQAMFCAPCPPSASAAPTGFSLRSAPRVQMLASMPQSSVDSGFGPAFFSSSSFTFGGSAPGYSFGAIAPSKPIPDIFEMPVYNFDSQKGFEIKTCEPFDFVNSKASCLQLERIRNMKSKKMQFLNAASMALICNTNLKKASDSYRLLITKFANDVRAVDSEFILKVALYCRQDLNIRSVSNFLLSYAAYHDETRPYLKKYYEACIRLPSDWIEVAELYQVFGDERLKSRSLPAALKRVMVKSFSKFDAYQLAKYNKDKTKKMHRTKDIKIDLSDTEEKGDKLSDTYYTLKQLIRMLHLNSPAEEIMCLLGKKYPITAEVFKNSGLSGIWDSQQAGKRMKLPSPKTWETQISLYGNTPTMWEGLIDDCKLPYMAMLRNLRNLILSGISIKHHEKVLKQLENKNAVLNSRQLPLQFYEAFKVLTAIEELLNKKDLSSPMMADDTPTWKRKRIEKTCDKMQNASNSLLERYKNAVSKALELSALHNLQPIPGKSLVICDVLQPDHLEIKNKDKAYHMCIMMGLMSLKACEDCKMNIIYGDLSEKIALNDEAPFLQNMIEVCLQHKNLCQNMQKRSSVIALKHVLDFYLKQQTYLKEKLDHVIYLRTYEADKDSYMRKAMTSFLHKYRQLVNPDLLYTDVDFSTSNYSFTDIDSSDEKDVYLCGNTTQLVKFIAERSTGGLLTCVENIDSKYNLSDNADVQELKIHNETLSEREIIPVLSKVPKWHTVRIFISSTFKDMHSERDMLIRYVIPELRKRAASLFIKINEVDLRWGIAETDYTKNRTAELCLLEAQKSDFFIGLLGDRYGTIYNFDSSVSEDLQWVKDCPKGLSITELEMYAGALNENKLQEKKALFYIRDNTFLSGVPEKWKGYFMSENLESKHKVDSLKSKILSSELKVFNGYPCKFAGILKDKPVLSGLDVFGKTVLNDLWNAVKEMHDKDPFMDDVAEEMYQQQLFSPHDYFVESKNFPTDIFIKKFQKECGIFLVSGTPGCGKTTFVVNMLQKLKNFSIVKFFIGLTPRSTDISYMLHFICESIARYHPVSSVFPKLTKDVINQFPDILQEAVNTSENNFVLLIDGLDHLEIGDQMLDWLPLNLPQGLRLICTASESSYAFRVLCEREAHGTNINIQNVVGFAHSDRECIVRHYLNMYGKALDESAFNNLMLQLVTKKDSGTPLYLRIACDFLRTYASFENFSTMLQSLPSSIPLLFQEIILQMENEYTSVLVQAALTLLCITTEGLDDADLHLLLSLALLDKGKAESCSFNDLINKITKLDSINLLPKVTYCSLVHLICTFAYGHNRFKRYNLTGTEFEKAVKKFYLNKNYTNFAKSMHNNIAAYYQRLCDLESDGSWKGRSGSAYRGLIYHLFNGKCYKPLFDNLCCLNFLEAAFSIGAADFLLEYYSLLLKEAQSGNNEAKKEVDIYLLTAFADFVSRNLHIFQTYPHLVTQQAMNEPSTSLVKLSLENIKTNKYCIIECLSVQTLDLRVATLGGFVKNITAASCQSSDDLAVLGSEDGYLKVLDFMSKKITRSFKSHSSAVTFICFAGKNRICTASSDTTLTIWNSVDFSRTFVLKGHNHTVSCCCADSSSNILFSSGWDNSVRLWSLWDGRSISVIDEFKCPVNCLDHHPSKQQIACGLWNGNVELWDTVSMKKVLALSNDCRSVKSIAYMTDGINIVSTYMNSDVVIWSSEQGLKMSYLKGHALPVRSLSYSVAGDAIVSGSEDCTLKVWSSESGLSLHTLSACKFCPISLMEIISPNILAVGFQNSDIWVVDINNGFVISKMSLVSDTVSCFSRINAAYCDTDDPFENWTDSSLVFGSQSGQIYIANFVTSSISSFGSIKARVTAIIHNKRIIISANSEGDIGVFLYLEKSSKVIYGAHERSVAALNLYMMDSNLCFISAGSDKVMKIWSVDCDELDINLKYKYPSRHSDYITSCCWYLSTNEIAEEKILTGSHDNNVILQEGESKTLFKGLKTSVVCIDFTDNYVLGCGSDGSVAIWFKDGKLLSYISGIDQSSAILSFHIDKDSSRNFDITLAFVDKDGSVKIRKPIQRSFSYSLEGHSKGITSCCINQNKEIISCSLDGTVSLWKLPMDIQDTNLNHSATVTDIIVSESNAIALSSDAHGSIILWELVQSPTASIAYGTKKTYTGGFVKALSWIKDMNFVCAITQTVADKEVYFVDILSYECTVVDDCKSHYLHVKFTHYFESEILCLHGSSTTETIVASFKSGDFVIITPNLKKKIKTSEDWILQAKIMQPGENIYFSLLNGSVKCFKVADLLKCSDYSNAPFQVIYSAVTGDSYFYTSTFWCESEEIVFCGDSNGWLRMYSKDNLSISKKVHDDSLTGILVIGKYVFTSSLDKTLKGWNMTTLEQVCLYYSPVPITCFVGFKDMPEVSTSSFTFLIGATSGTVQLLKFHHNK